MERESILKRLRALAAKSTESGCTEAEALAAAEKLAELLDRYGFSQADLAEADRIKDQITRECYYAGNRTLGNLVYVVVAVGRYCDVKEWGSITTLPDGRKAKFINFLGFEPDVLMAKYLLSLVESAMRTEWEAYRKQVRSEIDPTTRRWRNVGPKDRDSFEIGMMARLSKRLDEMKAARMAHIDEATKRTGQSLVLSKRGPVSDAFQALHLNFKPKRKSQGRRFAAGAFNAGADAADRVNITTGIGARRPDRAIA